MKLTSVITESGVHRNDLFTLTTVTHNKSFAVDIQTQDIWRDTIISLGKH